LAVSVFVLLAGAFLPAEFFVIVLSDAFCLLTGHIFGPAISGRYAKRPPDAKNRAAVRR